MKKIDIKSLVVGILATVLVMVTAGAVWGGVDAWQFPIAIAIGGMCAWLYASR